MSRRPVSSTLKVSINLYTKPPTEPYHYSRRCWLQGTCDTHLLHCTSQTLPLLLCTRTTTCSCSSCTTPINPPAHLLAHPTMADSQAHHHLGWVLCLPVSQRLAPVVVPRVCMTTTLSKQEDRAVFLPISNRRRTCPTSTSPHP